MVLLIVARAAVWWLALLIAFCGLMLIVTARAQRAQSRYVPFDYAGPLDVVGESFHLNEIAATFRAIGHDPFKPVTAALIPDPKNKYDSNAVAVYLVVGNQRRIVGHLPSEIAATVQPIVKSYIEQGMTPTVQAVIRPFTADDGRQLFSVTI